MRLAGCSKYAWYVTRSAKLDATCIRNDRVLSKGPFIHALRVPARRFAVLRAAAPEIVKVKVAHTRLPSVGFRSWSRFLAVSLQVTWVINPAIGFHYFPPGPQVRYWSLTSLNITQMISDQPGPQLPPQPLRGLLAILLLGEQGHNACEQFA